MNTLSNRIFLATFIASEGLRNDQDSVDGESLERNKMPGIGSLARIRSLAFFINLLASTIVTSGCDTFCGRARFSNFDREELKRKNISLCEADDYPKIFDSASSIEKAMQNNITPEEAYKVAQWMKVNMPTDDNPYTVINIIIMLRAEKLTLREAVAEYEERLGKQAMVEGAWRRYLSNANTHFNWDAMLRYPREFSGWTDDDFYAAFYLSPEQAAQYPADLTPKERAYLSRVGITGENVTKDFPQPTPPALEIIRRKFPGYENQPIAKIVAFIEGNINSQEAREIEEWERTQNARDTIVSEWSTTDWKIDTHNLANFRKCKTAFRRIADMTKDCVWFGSMPSPAEVSDIQTQRPHQIRSPAPRIVHSEPASAAPTPPEIPTPVITALPKDPLPPLPPLPTGYQLPASTSSPAPFLFSCSKDHLRALGLDTLIKTCQPEFSGFFLVSSSNRGYFLTKEEEGEKEYNLAECDPPFYFTHNRICHRPSSTPPVPSDKIKMLLRMHYFESE